MYVLVGVNVHIRVFHLRAVTGQRVKPMFEYGAGVATCCSGTRQMLVESGCIYTLAAQTYLRITRWAAEGGAD